MPDDDDNSNSGPDSEPKVVYRGENTTAVELNPHDRQQAVMISTVIGHFVKQACKMALADFCVKHQPTPEQGVRLWEGICRGSHPKLLDMILSATKEVHALVDQQISSDGVAELKTSEMFACAGMKVEEILDDDAEFFLAFARGEVSAPEGFSCKEYMNARVEELGGKPVSKDEISQAKAKLRKLVDPDHQPE